MTAHSEFLNLFLAGYDDLRAFLATLVRNPEDREDLFQNTAETLWAKFDEYDPKRPFGAWARGIAANKVLQHRTRSGRVPTPFSPQVITAILDAFQRREPMGSEALTALEKCMEPLSEDRRRILILRYVEQWSVRQIAEEIGATPAAASKTLTRLRKDMFDCVERRLGRGKQDVLP